MTRHRLPEADRYFQRALAVPAEVRSYKHEVITLTAIADNMGRWADSLWKDKQTDEAMCKAKLAYDYVNNAVQMAGSDDRAWDTLREEAYRLGNFLSEAEGVDAALPYFLDAIVKNPKRRKERYITSRACYHLSRKLLRVGRRDEAEQYYRLGERVRQRTERDRQMYDSLHAELFEERLTGTLNHVPSDRAYGFIVRDDIPGQQLFVHRTAFIPTVSSAELQALRGARVSFTIGENAAGIEARNVRLL